MVKIKKKDFNHRGLLFLILIVIFFIVINLCYYLFKDRSYNLVFNGQDEVKILSNLPITDESAKDLNIDNIQDGIIGYAEFLVELEKQKNITDEVKYEIYLTDITDTSVFKYDYVKVYLTDENGVLYKQFAGNSSPSYSDLRVSLNEPSKRILLTGKISPGETKKFKLRIWVADTYILNNEQREFKGKISVKAIS